MHWTLTVPAGRDKPAAGGSMGMEATEPAVGARATGRSASGAWGESAAAARRFDYFAFPRTGSHYLWACLTGLFDLVFFPNEHVGNPEARQRAEELNPHAFYALRLRDAGVPRQWVYVDPAARGLHGSPALGAWPLIIMIRDPRPTLYSYYHTAIDRWGQRIDDRVGWMRRTCGEYRRFYDAALTLAERHPARVHLVRYEALQAEAAELARLVDFVDVRPKLTVEFVHWWTEFDRMTKPGARTFFRSGSDRRWREDPAWRGDWRRAQPGDFSRYGYPAEEGTPAGVANGADRWRRLRRWFGG